MPSGSLFLIIISESVSVKNIKADGYAALWRSGAVRLCFDFTNAICLSEVSDEYYFFNALNSLIYDVLTALGGGVEAFFVPVSR